MRAGQTFGRYRIEEALGEGGMGQVFRAVDTRLGRSVALKVVHVDREDEPDRADQAAARILREARAAAALQHPNAVAIYDAGEIDGTLYMAMELVGGKTLRTLIAQGNAPWGVRVRWLAEIGCALRAAHGLGIIHRDVKPENVMVRHDGVVKVLDFGIAKRVPLALPAAQGASAFSTIPTAGGLVVGTPRYMAPEQVKGEAMDARADQFAWGVVAYEVLSGRSPWGSKDGVQLLLAIVGEDADPLGPLAPEVPTAVVATVQRAMQREPQGRFPSMNDVIACLEPFTARAARAGGTDLETQTDMAPLRAMTPASRSVVELAATHASSMEPARYDTSTPPSSAPSDSSAPEPPSGVPIAPPARQPGRAAAPRSRARMLAAVGGAAALVGSGVLIGELARSRSREAQGSGPQPSGAATVVTALPLPHSQSAEALAAYAAAMQSFRDAAFDAARQGFEKAVHLDPQLAAAYLRLALLDATIVFDELDARRHFHLAAQYRSTLSERDQMLLDGFEPCFLRDPPDLATAERRLAAVTERYPMDAEAHLHLGYLRYTRGRSRLAAESFRRATTLDPLFGQAWAYLAGAQTLLGDIDGALGTIAHCLDVSPGATECLWYRVLVHEQAGDCVAYEADVRQWIARDPGDYYGYGMLARALRANGKGHESVMAALSQKWTHVAPARRRRLELEDRSRVALGAGDFVLAAVHAKALEAVVGTEPGVTAHMASAALLLDAYEESGDDAKLRETAAMYLDRKDAWVMTVRVDDLAIADDRVPLLLGALARTGGITRDEAARQRTAWVSAWKSRTTEGFTNHLWIYAWAAPARTAEEARAALDALPEYQPLPPFTAQTMAQGFIGATYLLAGRPAEALPILERAAKMCTAYGEPVAHTRTWLHLGDARALSGKVDEACAAYAIVVSRWGAAKPRSRSADAARSAMVKLGCPR